MYFFLHRQCNMTSSELSIFPHRNPNLMRIFERSTITGYLLAKEALVNIAL